MFLVALSEYDQVLVESDNEVCMLYIASAGGGYNLSRLVCLYAEYRQLHFTIL